MPRIDIYCDATWIVLESLLMPLVKGWVFRARVASWRGQEIDLISDIVQESLRKTFEYAVKAQQHNIEIASLERLSIVIARNQLRDQRRKDSRLLHIESDADSSENAIFFRVDDPEEDILEQQYEAWLFCQVAREVDLFPEKTRLAIIADLAQRMEAQGELSGEPTPLRQAFLEKGVYLETYIQLLPVDPVAKARQSSLASLAYKRIAKLVSADQS
jgi:DNA-directed RNA polymerase specialized sigma24 family protein